MITLSKSVNQYHKMGKVVLQMNNVKKVHSVDLKMQSIHKVFARHYFHYRRGRKFMLGMSKIYLCAMMVMG